MIFTSDADTLLGKITMASDGKNLIGLWFAGQKFFSSGLDEKNCEENKNLPVFELTKKWLNEYFLGKNPNFTPPLAPKGTVFRETVWKILLTIPYGETRTYGDIAKQVAKIQGKPRQSAQAVGGAVGHNPISIIIPCHRVVGSGGNLTGYAGGLDKKIALLKLEGGYSENFYLPKKSKNPN
jgi:methylated-DNA-[protein]-cysteine S-methyltransferase